MIHNDNEKTIRYVDEAKVIDAEIRKAQYQQIQKRYDAEDREFEQKYAKWKEKFGKWKKIELCGLICAIPTIVLTARLGEINFDSFLSTIISIPRLLLAIICVVAYLGLIIYGPYLYFSNPKPKYQQLLDEREIKEEKIREDERNYSFHVNNQSILNERHDFVSTQKQGATKKKYSDAFDEYFKNH